MSLAPLVKGPMRKRADIVLVERGFFSSRARAQAAIAAGLVSVGGVALKKASEEVAGDAPIEAEARPSLGVARRGQARRRARRLRARSHRPRLPRRRRLDRRLHRCAAGARRGEGHRRRRRPRTARSAPRGGPARPLARRRRRARAYREMLGERPEAIVVDVSFISQRLVLPHVLKLAAERAWLVSLVKPQFEVGRGRSRQGPGQERSGARARMRRRARRDRSARLDGARPHPVADPRRRRGAGISHRRAP